MGTDGRGGSGKGQVIFVPKWWATAGQEDGWWVVVAADNTPGLAGPAASTVAAVDTVTAGRPAVSVAEPTMTTALQTGPRATTRGMRIGNCWMVILFLE